MKRKFYFPLLLLVTLSVLLSFAGVSALAGYGLDWWAVAGGGATSSTGGTYTLGGTIGQPEAGTSTGGAYTLSGGFWSGADASAPTVVSSLRANDSPTSASSVDFTVTFSETVTGVNPADFTVATTGLTGAAVTGVSGSEAVYTVTASTGNGNGTLRLEVLNDGSIQDLSGNPLSSGYTGGETYQIVKTYALSGNAGVAGATLTYTGGSTTADGSGVYSFAVAPGWSGTVTPSKTGYTFNPTSKSYTNVTADQVNQDYIATLNSYTLSGNAGVAEALLTYTGGTTSADGSGHYAFTVSHGWTGTVTPSKTGYSFSPANREYANLTASQANQDYTATLNSLTISGNAGVGGATLAYTGGSATAESGGAYTFTVPSGWSGTATPSKSGYRFTPTNRTYTNLTSDQTAQDYTAQLLPFTDLLLMNGGAWNKYDFATGGYLGGVWTGTNASCTPALIDYDGDKIKEYSQLCGGAWHFYNKNGTYNKGIWVGEFPGSIPVPGDYNGDGIDEPVLFSAGAWHFFDFATATYNAALSRWTGTGPGCVPAPLDYNGDRKMKFSLFCGGPWHFYASDGGYAKGIWIGASTTDIPAPADYDGNGTEEVVLFSNGVWHFFDYPTATYNVAKSTYTGLPDPAVKPAPIDYNQDGALDFIAYANGTWYFYNATGSLNKSIATGSPSTAVPMSRRFLP